MEDQSHRWANISIQRIDKVKAWEKVIDTKYTTDPSFYNKLENLANKSRESINDVISKRIPDVNNPDDLSLWLKLLDEDGLSKNASDLLDKESLSTLENFSNNKRSGAASVVEGDNFNPVSATNIKNGSIDYFDGINPLIKDLLEQIKKSGIKSSGHGKCAEVKVLSDVLNNHFKNKVPTLEEAIDYLKGTRSKAVDINKKGAKLSSHGKFKCACSSCRELLIDLNIKQVAY